MPARTRRSPATTGTRCGACGTPVIRQTGDVIPVLVDADPIEPGTDAAIRGPNRLTWCAPPTLSGGPPRLLWVYTGHPPDCPHPHHADHACTGRTPPIPSPSSYGDHAQDALF